MTDHETMQRVDALLSHVWMVRTFLKHSDEGQDDESLQEVFRDLYDFMLALGPAWTQQDPVAYFKQAQKKLAKLRAATERFLEIQPDISTHTNFQMAARSLSTAVEEISRLVQGRTP